MTNKYRPKIIPICSPKSRIIKDKALDAVFALSAIILYGVLAFIATSIVILLADLLWKAIQ